MPKYEVCITADFTMSAVLEIEAESKVLAEEFAWRQRHDVEMTVDDNPPHHYVSWVEEA